MSNCLSLKRCKLSCMSMGASRYRWFHEHGCCQCIGSSCINYGLNKPKCHLCPNEDEDGDDSDIHEENEVVVDEIEEEDNIIEEVKNEEIQGLEDSIIKEKEILKEEVDEFDIKRV